MTTKATTEEEKPIMVMRQSKNGGWQDLASVENRDQLREARAKKRIEAKDRL